jgi:DNA-binding transcriptional MerR regulator
MTWSTSQLAELSGTTVKAVRHYHQIGLLAEPERASNGYKQYGVEHLVRMLRIKRLSDLGVPLGQIATMGEPETQSADALRVIDAELAASIERLQNVRAELALILTHKTPTDLPAGFGEGTTELSEADRALLLIYSRLFSETAMDDLRVMSLDSRRRPIDTEFDTLPADADEATRQELADRYAPYVRELAADYPWLGTHTPGGEKRAGDVVGQALVALYNPAQIDVLARTHGIVHAPADD